MTTVCVSNGIMVADSGCFISSRREGGYVKIIKNHYGDVLGLSGECSASSRVKKVFLSLDYTQLQTPVVLEDPDLYGLKYTALLWSTEYKSITLNESGSNIEMIPLLEDTYAIGSGSDFAIAAIMAGATAERAVEIACKLDPFSVPPLQVVELT